MIIKPFHMYFQCISLSFIFHKFHSGWCGCTVNKGILTLVIMKLFWEPQNLICPISIIYQHCDDIDHWNPPLWKTWTHNWSFHSAWSIPWLLMSWRHMEPRHQQLWYQPFSPRMVQHIMMIESSIHIGKLASCESFHKTPLYQNWHRFYVVRQKPSS